MKKGYEKIEKKWKKKNQGKNRKKFWKNQEKKTEKSWLTRKKTNQTENSSLEIEIRKSFLLWSKIDSCHRLKTFYYANFSRKCNEMNKKKLSNSNWIKKKEEIKKNFELHVFGVSRSKYKFVLIYFVLFKRWDKNNLNNFLLNFHFWNWGCLIGEHWWFYWRSWRKNYDIWRKLTKLNESLRKFTNLNEILWKVRHMTTILSGLRSLSKTYEDLRNFMKINKDLGKSEEYTFRNSTKF